MGSLLRKGAVYPYVAIRRVPHFCDGRRAPDDREKSQRKQGASNSHVDVIAWFQVSVGTWLSARGMSYSNPNRSAESTHSPRSDISPFVNSLTSSTSCTTLLGGRTTVVHEEPVADVRVSAGDVDRLEQDSSILEGRPQLALKTAENQLPVHRPRDPRAPLPIEITASVHIRVGLQTHMFHSTRSRTCSVLCGLCGNASRRTSRKPLPWATRKGR